MNIRNNIINYLYDKNYVITLYDDYIYFFNYKYLESFSEKKINLCVHDKDICVIGDNLRITKITKEELLINGNIKKIEMKNNHEK